MIHSIISLEDSITDFRHSRLLVAFVAGCCGFIRRCGRIQAMGVFEHLNISKGLLLNRLMVPALIALQILSFEACMSSGALVEESPGEQVSCSLGMVAVPTGEFFMGCKHGEDKECMSLDEPWRKADIEKAFCIDRTEVTNEQYSKCVQAGDCPSIDDVQCAIFNIYIDRPVKRFIGGRLVDSIDAEGYEGVSWKVGPLPPEFLAAGQPVVCVNWEEAKAYCEWAGKRLPTDAEWEKASRGTDGRLYPWGAKKPSCEHTVMHGGGAGCGRKTTWPVGSKPEGTSPYGALDMSGNVWEWTADACSDAKGTQGHSMRGGSWIEEDYYLFHTSFKGCGRPILHPGPLRHNNLGFRCATDSKIYWDAAE
jgi:formylglycine-generating enzyme required for sulfatase activity